MQSGKIGDESRILDSVWPKKAQSFTTKLLELGKELFSNTTTAIRNFISYRVGDARVLPQKRARKGIKSATVHRQQVSPEKSHTQDIVPDSLKQPRNKISKREQKQKKYNFSMNSSSISSVGDIAGTQNSREEPMNEQPSHQYPIEESQGEEQEEIEDYGHKKVKLIDQQPKKKLSPAVQQKMNVIMVETFEKVFKTAQQRYNEDQLHRRNQTAETKYQQYLAENIYGIYPIERTAVDKVKALQQKIKILNEHDNYAGYTPMEEETNLNTKTQFNIPKLMSHLQEEEKNRLVKIRQVKEALRQEEERIMRQKARQQKERVEKEQRELERIQMEEKKKLEEIQALQESKTLDELKILGRAKSIEAKDNGSQSRVPNESGQAAQASQVETAQLLELSPISKLDRSVPTLRDEVREKIEIQRMALSKQPPTTEPQPQKIPDSFSLFNCKSEIGQVFSNFTSQPQPIQKKEQVDRSVPPLRAEVIEKREQQAKLSNEQPLTTQPYCQKAIDTFTLVNGQIFSKGVSEALPTQKKEEVQQATVATPKKEHNPFCEQSDPIKLSQVIKNFGSPDPFKFRSHTSGQKNSDSEKILTSNIFSNNFPQNPTNTLNSNTQFNFPLSNPPPTRGLFDAALPEDRQFIQQSSMNFFGSNPNHGSQTFSNGSNSAILSNSGMPNVPPVAPPSFYPSMNLGSFMSKTQAGTNPANIFLKNNFIQPLSYSGGQLFGGCEGNKSQTKSGKSKGKKEQRVD